jgi:hypothetical protein
VAARLGRREIRVESSDRVSQGWQGPDAAVSGSSSGQVAAQDFLMKRNQEAGKKYYWAEDAMPEELRPDVPEMEFATGLLTQGWGGGGGGRPPWPDDYMGFLPTSR